MNIVKRLLRRYEMFETLNGMCDIKLNNITYNGTGIKEYDLGDSYVGIHDRDKNTLTVTYRDGIGYSYIVLGSEMDRLEKGVERKLPIITAPLTLDKEKDNPHPEELLECMNRMKGALGDYLEEISQLNETSAGLRLFKLLALDFVVPLLIIYYALRAVS